MNHMLTTAGCTPAAQSTAPHAPAATNDLPRTDDSGYMVAVE